MLKRCVSIEATYFVPHNCTSLFTGKVRAIGVSNYSVSHLKELRQYATVLPHLLQVQRMYASFQGSNQVGIEPPKSKSWGRNLECGNIMCMSCRFSVKLDPHQRVCVNLLICLNSSFRVNATLG